MHEYSVVSALIENVQQQVSQLPSATVKRLHVAVGELAGLDATLFKTAYEVFRQRTVCAGADMVVRPVQARWQCPVCERALAPGLSLRCPGCDRPGRLTRGEEIVLERIELEVPDV